jgi:DNA-binding transcriptional ArsR family regulator
LEFICFRFTSLLEDELEALVLNGTIFSRLKKCLYGLFSEGRYSIDISRAPDAGSGFQTHVLIKQGLTSQILKIGTRLFLEAAAVKDPNLALKGNVLKVYMYLLLKKRDEPVGVRELQRDLEFSSPTLAKYHLQRLVDLGLVKQNEDGGYSLLREVKVDIVEPFLTVGSLLIPRLFAYAVTISILFAYLVFVAIPSGNIPFIEYFAVVTSAAGLVSLWYESLRSWSRAPK